MLPLKMKGTPSIPASHTEEVRASTIPTKPPNEESTTASTRNCMSTSFSRAPIARRMPISRVRSVTDTSMMFMIPIPPTRRLTAATALSRAGTSTSLRVMSDPTWCSDGRLGALATSRTGKMAIAASPATPAARKNAKGKPYASFSDPVTAVASTRLSELIMESSAVARTACWGGKRLENNTTIGTQVAAASPVIDRPMISPVAKILAMLGSKADFLPLGNPKTAMGTLIGIQIWQFTPFFMLMILAGLQTLDPALHDAARVDGASWWQDVVYVIFPHVRELLLTLALFDIVTLAASFDLIWITTNGGPVRSTEVISTYLYRDGFLSMHWNRAAASGMILLVLLALVAFFMIRQMRED